MSSQLEFTKEIEKNTAGIYQKIKSVVPALEWPLRGHSNAGTTDFIFW